MDEKEQKSPKQEQIYNAFDDACLFLLNKLINEHVILQEETRALFDLAAAYYKIDSVRNPPKCNPMDEYLYNG